MKRFLVVIFLFLVSSGSNAQTADEIVNRFLEAAGGVERLNEVKTLQYSQLIKLKSPMGEIQMPLKYFREKNKLFRLESSLNFGAQPLEFYTVITDTSGYIKIPNSPMIGLAGGVQKMTEKERMLQIFQMDASGMFSTLVGYAAKGHKIELVKEEKVNKEDAYKLKHTLSSGQEIIYFISKASNLVVKMDTKGSMAASMSGLGTVMSGMGGGRIDKMEVSTLYSDYIVVDGLKFPGKIIIKSAMGDLESAVTNIQINKPIDRALYIAQ